MLWPGDLRWAELDPAEHAWEPEIVRAEIARVVEAAASVPPSRRDLNALQVALDGVFFALLGPWGGVWQSTMRDGGPVRVAAYDLDKLLRSKRDYAAITDRVMAVLADWRAYLEECAAAFTIVRAEAASLETSREVERAAAHLLPMILGRTHADDAWYSTLSAALVWYLDSAGYDRDAVASTVHEAVSGRFESWIEPDPATRDAAFAEIGERTQEATLARDGTPRDALADWLANRGKAFYAGATYSASPVIADGHHAFIDRVDRGRDPGRADRMTAALLLARDTARRRVPLTFDLLAECQGIVLGRPAAMRTTDAFAKGGRERYPRLPDLEARVAAALAEIDNAKPTHDAARVYFDVCFFHPFDDGNARAARIALDYVLTANALALHLADPLFLISRDATDSRGAARFFWALNQVVGSMRR